MQDIYLKASNSYHKMVFVIGICQEAKKMALSMIDKLTNYLMPTEGGGQREKPVGESTAARGSNLVNLSVHSTQSGKLKVLIVSSAKYDEVHTYADHLKANIAVAINLTDVDVTMQESIKDFMNGVCYVLDGNVQRVAESVIMYTPSDVDIEKELYAYSVPAYVNPRID